jgi:hypothetical protein
VDVPLVCCAVILAELGVKKPSRNKSLKNKSRQTSEGKMTNETTENFWKVWNTFKWPESQPIVYKLYYNDDGSPQCYSMENLSGKYIEVDRETYVLTPWNVKVVDGRLTYIKPKITTQKLQPNEHAGTCCHELDICVVVGADQPHIKWNKVTNEIC